MSIFIKVDKFGGRAKLFRLRGLYSAIGEDEHGILTCRAPARPFFMLYRSGECMLIKAACSYLTVCGEGLPRGQRRPLPAGAAVCLRDYRFAFVPVPAAWETLAETDLPLHTLCALTQAWPAPRCPVLHYEIASLSRRYPLFPGLELVIGAAEDAALHVDFPKVQAAHCSARYEGGAVRITPLQGAVEIDGRSITGPYAARDGARLTLAPAAIDLRLTFPAEHRAAA